MLILTVSNQKGGVGKTTTCVNLAAELGRLGYSVLAVDIDPQANCTSGLGISPEDFELSLYDVLLGEAEAKDAVLPTQWEGVSILPATIDLAGAEIELASVISRETRLRRHLRSLDSFDLAIVDCPPSLGMLTINALVASDKLIIPIQCEYYALEGVGQLSKTVGLVRDSLNPELEISGVLLTMYDSRTRLSNEVAEEVRRQFGSVAFSSVIPRNVRLSEAPSHAAPIGYYDPSSTGAQAYGDLAREVSGLWLKRAH
ncbi:Sporulation initiation inhibitor protein Soj [bioreactor metagenome]|jgi:chromosome partitioning protein|uniref:Sporulation initiation inhibitor protein Soj n=1 Tax=bioreactor metagenome TaxID=1076179 RepID=A0A644XPR5_9ZZZZ|nr:AAA family ATPase [Aminivibrio sp.]HPF86069.1 AAA family ATPase [Aminivibrio sp.]HRX26842.1 AAA family ATPase [Aminivibrio sp.]